MTRSAAVAAACLLIAAGVATLAGEPAAPEYGRATFTNNREPPALAELDPAQRELFELGQLVFNSQWLPAGTPGAERRDGLGPLFIGASCDGCHNNGARGQGAGRGGLLPSSFVMQLGGAVGSDYGAVLNTSALEGYAREAELSVTYVPVTGRYADGSAWTLQRPRYDIARPGYGVLPAGVVLKPRIGPALFGAGLLETVEADELQGVRRSQPAPLRGVLPWRGEGASRRLGRFGWQAQAVSIEDQTQRALAREMGLTTVSRSHDDCTAVQLACLDALQGGSPEVSPEFLNALLVFQRQLAVPQRAAPDPPGGEDLFIRLGCQACHRSQLTTATAAGPRSIRPYTDLLLHDLGEDLADRSIAGVTIHSEWRTAALWGLGHTLARGEVALLHDGRARSPEEAILWHGGQARAARDWFVALPDADRELLLSWLATL